MRRNSRRRNVQAHSPQPWSKLSALLCLLALLSSVSMQAEEAKAPPDSARIVVEQMLSLVQEQDWDTYATMVHPGELSKAKRFMFPVVRLLDSTGMAKGALPVFFDGSKTIAEVASLDSVRFFAGTMALLTNLVPALGTTMAASDGEIIGSVKEGIDTTHVVYKAQTIVDSDTTNELQVITLIHYGPRWYTTLRFDVEQLAKAFQKQAEQSEGGN